MRKYFPNCFSHIHKVNAHWGGGWGYERETIREREGRWEKEDREGKVDLEKKYNIRRRKRNIRFGFKFGLRK
jgi:hypothetical protein